VAEAEAKRRTLPTVRRSSRSAVAWARLADGRDLPLPGASFDLAVLHTVVSHAPDPPGMLAQAFRVLRPGGTLAVFDGDYNTMSVATGGN